MARAIPIVQWVRTLVLALGGVNDSLAYALDGGDRESAAILVGVARGLIDGPWANLVAGIPRWRMEQERFHALATRVDASARVPVEDEYLRDLTFAAWNAAENKIAEGRWDDEAFR